MKRIAEALVVAALGACASLAPRAAVAGEADDEAARLTEEAANAYQQGDYGTCRTRATEAWSKFQHAQIAGLLGSCEVKLGMWAEGATHIDFYLKNSTAEVNPEARDLLAKAREHVSEVTLACHPEGVTFSIDGHAVGEGQQTIFLDPGPHTIGAEKQGYEPKQEPETIAAGTKITINLTLDPKKAGGTAKPGARLPIWPGAVALGAGAVSAGVGVALLAIASGKDSDAKAQGQGLTCDPATLSSKCQDLQSTLSNKASLGNGGIAATIVGGVLVAAGAVYLPIAVTSRRAPQSDQAAGVEWRVVPVASPDFGGAMILGAF